MGDNILKLYRELEDLIESKSVKHFSKDIYFNKHGPYDYSKISFFGNRFGLCVEKSDYEKTLFCEDLDHGSDWYGSKEINSEHISLTKLIDLSKEYNLEKEICNKLEKIIIERSSK